MSAKAEQKEKSHRTILESAARLVRERGIAGARVADVGCGYGASAILLAQAFPRSRFFGFDSHPGSVETAAR